MSKQMTPCERLGYKVGDEFEVISHHAFKKGQVVTLHEDDGTECPLFAGDGGGAGVFDGVECSFATLNEQVRKIANKLKPAKQALADAIHQNGGWPESELLDFATSNAFGEVLCSASHQEKKGNVWVNGYYYRLIACIKGTIANWHQTILSREEYYQSYPNVDADGWIEWNGGECPVSGDDIVDVAYSTYGAKLFSAEANSLRWSKRGLGGDIIAYRLHKPEFQPELFDFVARLITEPEEILSESASSPYTPQCRCDAVDVKPTIEQLAQDYRNKLDFANSKQHEADDAKVAADAALGELERAGESLGLLIGVAKPDREPELVITDWRDLQVNDVIFVGEYDGYESGEYVVVWLEDSDYDGDYAVIVVGIDGIERCMDTAMEWRFIRRP